MPPRKAPQDHRPKVASSNGSGPAAAATLEELEEYFSFELDGQMHVMPQKTLDILTIGFIRANRRRDETDFVFTCLEELAGETKEGEQILKIIDNMSREDFIEFQRAFTEHLGATLGE